MKKKKGTKITKIWRRIVRKVNRGTTQIGILYNRDSHRIPWRGR